ncbi:MAG: hypothetical protein M3Z36_13735 [Acidobacteriota bacterium]|nr:hypothetical protein [Acidobacteriota bacterium]
MDGIDPKNLSAQLSYRGAGNPPSTHTSSAIANCFPGLEFDFRNVWRRIFVGIELHEANGFVTSVDPNATSDIRQLAGHTLISVDGDAVVTRVSGPRVANGSIQTLEENVSLEWSNALAKIMRKAGTKVPCVFQVTAQGPQTATVMLEVRQFFDRNTISKDLVHPGELTQSLCSPWQNDYRECGCYYWAASRPDYVNVETAPDGKSRGDNWLQKGRQPGTPHTYSLNESDLVTYDDLFQNWEKELKFQIGGKDTE